MDESGEQEEEKKNGSAAHVRIFGVDVDATGDHDWRRRKEEWKAERRKDREERHCHYEGRSVFWGLFVLFLGIVFFLSTLGLLPHGFWHEIAPFWPALLILWGLDILMGRSWFSRIVIFIVALVLFLGIVAYGLVRSSSPLVTRFPPNVVNAAGNINLQNPLQQ
jgi:hypothetical protein